MFRDSIFLFQIQKIITEIDEYEKKISFGDYEIKYCKSTPMMCANADSRELFIYGYAVDVRNGDSELLAEKILKDSQTIDDILAYEYYLGGKYLLFYRDINGLYIVPDATGSIPLCYSVGVEQVVCASNSECIARELALIPDKELVAIREKSEISQAMPYNTTIYKEIEHLLPNHYFLLSEGKSVRVVISKVKQKTVSFQEVAMQTSSYIENFLNYYKNKFKIYCPITSGRDSRVIVAYLLANKKQDETIKTYTIKHSFFSENEPDIVFPKQISDETGVDYTQLSESNPTKDLQDIFNYEFGNTNYSKQTLMIANTIKNAYGDGAIINGDIIGQVGKCSLHRDIFEFLATPRYFRCKLHNYSHKSLCYIKAWIDEIKNTNEKANLFDLFSIENRMGRWAAQENLIYNMIGQTYLNIFNSRCIIYQWTSVPRKERKFSKIHLCLIEKKFPSLLKIPFEPDSVIEKLAKANGVFYYVSSFAKYYIEKIRFKTK